jgi:amidase
LTDFLQNCGGSSSGSAIGVAGGFVPISIGTETVGSLNMPATRAALYTIKPTMGLVSSAGIIPVSPFADSAGPMAKSAHDIATLMDILVDQTKTKMPSGGYTGCLTASFENISIGALDPEVWNVPPHVTTPNEGASKQMVSRSSHISDARPVCETN